ncbi:MAG: Trehalose-6-phosphate synthase [Gammaproteobacteria bacterium]|nr:Trehalose-6-phosphate synthase [Gammaproteobacteria bacterium]
MNPSPAEQQLVIVSNRLPFIVGRDPAGRLEARPASGGLVTAMLPILRQKGGTWIGWTGLPEKDDASPAALAESVGWPGFAVVPVALSDEEVVGFYEGFSNEIIWPLFHDLPSFCEFAPSHWDYYLRVNRKFARAIADNAAPDSLVWVHDYHLINVGSELRQLGARLRTAFFLHIPFPSIDMFMKLPWRQSLLRSLLEYGLVGFQTLNDRRNYVQCLRRLLRGVSVSGKGQVLRVTVGDRHQAVGHFPIGIDFADFAHRAAAPEVRERAQALHNLLPDRRLLFGVDRLDYTKGILLRLRAYREALIRHPELRQRVTLIQVVVPSREHISTYFDLRTQIEQLVSRINGEFTEPGGWVPIHYVFRSLDPVDLLAYYRAAEVALVTPLKDGMNLVAKEYCTCSIEEDCVLVLSEFAGAAAQLRGGALMVNPYDIEGVADAIYRACCMPEQERRRRMRRMRREIMRRDLFWWVSSFFNAVNKEVPHELQTNQSDEHGAMADGENPVDAEPGDLHRRVG